MCGRYGAAVWGTIALSYKVSVDSISESDADDVLIALIDILFRQCTIKSWVIFGSVLSMTVALTGAFWLADQLLGAAISSMTGMVVTIGRTVGMSRERPTTEAKGADELRAQA